MAFLKRVFSSDYRRALAAEAEGDFLEAARAYALAGERAKVAEMHLLTAERGAKGEGAGGPDARLAELRAAIRWADGDDGEARAVRRRIARALLAHVRTGGIVADSDRSLLLEAAALFSGAGDHSGAGECYELAGDDTLAAEAYQRAGEVERLEAVLQREETRRHAATKKRERFDEYQLRLAGGERDQALRALRQYLELDPQGPGGPARQLLKELEAKRIADGKVTLRLGGEGAVVYLGRFPFTIGREASCDIALRESNVSRRHVEVHLRDGRFIVRDCGSRNGTTVRGLPVTGEIPLDGGGELGLGAQSVLRYFATGGMLTLESVGGIDLGLKVAAAAAPIAFGSGSALLRFADGRPLVEAAAGWALRLNGARVRGAVQLVHGDVVEAAGPGDALVRAEVG